MTIRRAGTALMVLAPAAALAQPAPGDPPPATPIRDGVTFEGNIGVGLMHAYGDTDSDVQAPAVGGGCVGVGAWLFTDIALGVRFAGVLFPRDRQMHRFLGPVVQYWLDDHIWLGGGIGLGVGADHDADFGGADFGLGLDLRAGYSWTLERDHTVNASVEVTPGRYAGVDAVFTGGSLLVGYQRL